MTRKALLIGTDDYSTEGIYNKLNAPRTDLELVAEVLQLEYVGFEILNTLYNPSLREAQYEIECFMQASRRGDDLLLYLVGHGDRRNGQYFYILADTVPNYQLSTAISETFLRRAIEKNRCRSKSLIIDTCRSGQMALLRPLGHSDRNKVDVGFEQLRGEGTSLLCAAAADQKTFERRDPDDSCPTYYSLFTSALCHGLRHGRAADHSGRIKPRALIAFAQQAISAYAKYFKNDFQDGWMPPTPVHTVYLEQHGGPTLGCRPASKSGATANHDKATLFDRLADRNWDVLEYIPNIPNTVANSNLLGSLVTGIQSEEIIPDARKESREVPTSWGETSDSNKLVPDRLEFSLRRVPDEVVLILELIVRPGVATGASGLADGAVRIVQSLFRENLRRAGMSDSDIAKGVQQAEQYHLIARDGPYYIVNGAVMRI